MKFQEINSKLKEIGITPEIMNNYPYFETKEKVKFDKAGFGTIEEVGTDEQYDGKDCQKVYHFVDHDVYITFSYQYSSWDSSDFDTEFYEARPQTESVIRYVNVKQD